MNYKTLGGNETLTDGDTMKRNFNFPFRHYPDRFDGFDLSLYV